MPNITMTESPKVPTILNTVPTNYYTAGNKPFLDDVQGVLLNFDIKKAKGN